MSVPTCVLGMHRSGTSLVARMMNILGVDLGPASALGPIDADNPKGHWEHVPLRLLNDDILHHFGGDWLRPPAWPEGWVHDSRLADVTRHAREILDRDFGSAQLWGWKDPRTCVTLPFWQHVIGPMRYVLCVRNPAEVAASLLSRDGIDPGVTGELWLAHAVGSLTHTTGMPRIVVHYEDAVDNWEGTLARLAAFVGVPDRAADPVVLAATRDFVESDLRHHRCAIADLVDNPQVPLVAKSVFLALRALPSMPANPANLDVLASQAIAAHTALRAQPGLAADLSAARARRHTLEQDVHDLCEALAAQRALGHHLTSKVDDLHDSGAWHLVKASRRALHHVLPEGSRLRHRFTAALRRAMGAPAPRR